ncbi:hypothetical protein EON83_29185 [bacterium]|nr:MAG: hypothetical protein EON83_29185 [bacterium]
MLSRLDSPFLALASLCYLGAMLLFWAQLFLARGSEKVSLVKFSRASLWAGAVAHLVSIAGQGPALFSVKAGVVGLFGWFLIVTFLMVGRRVEAGVGAIVAPLALCAALYSLTASQLHSWTPTDRFSAFWLVVHVFVILGAYVSLAFAFAASLLYLVQEALLKKRQLSGLWQKLPSLQVADEWIFRASAFGLALLTLGLFTGIVFSSEQPYHMLRDPKTIFSALTWAIFALYLGARWKLGWHGRRSNLFVIYGFVVMAFSFFGVPHLVNP